MKLSKEVTYRNIAKMLCSALPVEGEDFSLKVEEYLQVIKKLKPAQRTALKAAYIFSRKVPKYEREDLFQDLALTLLKLQTKDEKLAYAVARCDWKDWYKKYTIRQHYSLDSIVEDTDGNQTPFGELLVGEVQFEVKLNGDLDGQALYEKLPSWIKTIVDKRLIGKSITGGERIMLNKWVASKPHMLTSLVS